MPSPRQVKVFLHNSRLEEVQGSTAVQRSIYTFQPAATVIPVPMVIAVVIDVLNFRLSTSQRVKTT